MWHMGDGWVWFVLFWGLVIWAIVTVVRRREPGDRGGRSEPSAIEILERRYARGAVGQDEFERVRRSLTGGVT